MPSKPSKIAYRNAHKLLKVKDAILKCNDKNNVQDDEFVDLLAYQIEIAIVEYRMKELENKAIKYNTKNTLMAIGLNVVLSLIIYMVIAINSMAGGIIVIILAALAMTKISQKIANWVFDVHNE